MAPLAHAIRWSALSLLASLVGCHVDVISDQEVTATAIGEKSYRIGMSLKANGKLPADLTVLPVRQNYMNRITDAWKRTLIYRVDGDSFTLTSLGKDGLAGGAGADSDMVRKYRVSNGEVEDVP